MIFFFFFSKTSSNYDVRWWRWRGVCAAVLCNKKRSCRLSIVVANILPRKRAARFITGILLPGDFLLYVTLNTLCVFIVLYRYLPTTAYPKWTFIFCVYILVWRWRVRRKKSFPNDCWLFIYLITRKPLKNEKTIHRICTRGTKMEREYL